MDTLWVILSWIGAIHVTLYIIAILMLVVEQIVNRVFYGTAQFITLLYFCIPIIGAITAGFMAIELCESIAEGIRRRRKK